MIEKNNFSKQCQTSGETASGDFLRHRVKNPLHAPYLSSTAAGLSANARRKCCFFPLPRRILSLNTWVGDKGWWALIVLIIRTKEGSQDTQKWTLTATERLMWKIPRCCHAPTATVWQPLHWMFEWSSSDPVRHRTSYWSTLCILPSHGTPTYSILNGKTDESEGICQECFH